MQWSWKGADIKMDSGERVSKSATRVGLGLPVSNVGDDLMRGKTLE